MEKAYLHTYDFSPMSGFRWNRTMFTSKFEGQGVSKARAYMSHYADRPAYISRNSEIVIVNEQCKIAFPNKAAKCLRIIP